MRCLLQSYLMSRRQFVSYNGCDSSTQQIEYGVPQGSILGPLLFILQMNDLTNSSKLLFAILFADDTSVFLEGKEYTHLIEMLNSELKKLTIWFNANKLTVNVKKTHYMVFHRARIKTSEIEVVMQNKSINFVTSTKFLGIIIDNKLKWNQHITYVKHKISKAVGILYKIRNFLAKSTLLSMYYSLVFPYLIYCIEIWGNASAVQLDALIKIQKKCVRTISFSEFLAPTHLLFERLNILKSDNLVIQRISLLMYKYSIGEVPSPISLLFRTNITYHEHNTRRASCLHTPIGRSEAIYQTFSYRGVHIWNYISLKVNTDVSYACFKKLVKHHLQSNRTPLIRLNV